MATTSAPCQPGPQPAHDSTKQPLFKTLCTLCAVLNEQQPHRVGVQRCYRHSPMPPACAVVQRGLAAWLLQMAVQLETAAGHSPCHPHCMAPFLHGHQHHWCPWHHRPMLRPGPGLCLGAPGWAWVLRGRAVQGWWHSCPLAHGTWLTALLPAAPRPVGPWHAG